MSTGPDSKQQKANLQTFTGWKVNKPSVRVAGLGRELLDLEYTDERKSNMPACTRLRQEPRAEQLTSTTNSAPARKIK